MITVLTPYLSAAKSFSFRPPIGRTFPRRVISPVIATSFLTGLFVRADKTDVAIVIPADGPSFGTAPSGTWMWMSVLDLKFGSSLKSSAFDAI